LYAGATIGSNAFVSKLNPQGTALVYSSYLGGSSSDSASAIAVDAVGNAYVIGSASSADFPSVNPLPASLNSGRQFLAKINADGSGLAYSTRFNALQLNAIAVDGAGSVYLTGSNNRTDFPAVNAISLTDEEENKLLQRRPKTVRNTFYP
jgi:hypothetical protein